MGLLTGLLKLPALPLTGAIAVAEVVRDQAERELHDPARIRAQLEDVARMREDGRLSDDQATAWEDVLVERLLTRHTREERHG